MPSLAIKRNKPQRAVRAAKPARPETLTEQAYRQLEEEIVTLRLEPGEFLSEYALATSLKIGRTPIREALQRLARENLVRSIPHRGTFVTDVNITDLARITEVRVVLEAHAARLATEKLTSADRESIEELLVQLQGQVTDQRDLMHLDQRIHRLVYRCSHNSFLEATLERYLNLSLRLWYLVLDREVRLREAVDEHVQLLKAVLAGDGDNAEEIMRRHVVGFEREIRKVLVER